MCFLFARSKIIAVLLLKVKYEQGGAIMLDFINIAIRSI